MSAALCDKFILSPTCMLVVSPGSRKLVLSDFRIPQLRYLSGFPVRQHGKEGSKEGSRRSPQGDEGKEGVRSCELCHWKDCYVASWVTTTVSVLSHLYLGTRLSPAICTMDVKCCEGRSWSSKRGSASPDKCVFVCFVCHTCFVCKFCLLDFCKKIAEIG